MKRIATAVAIVAALAACKKDSNNHVEYKVNRAASRAKWKGAAPDHYHTGSFDVTGSFKAGTNGQIIEGDFVIPIASIQNFDLLSPEREKLLNHLQSDEFLNVLLHPEARFHISKAMPYSGAGVAGANFMITGLFSLIGQTHELSFPARISTSADSLHANAVFSFNRLKWGMTSYSDPQGGLYILPDIEMKLSISAALQK